MHRHLRPALAGLLLVASACVQPGADPPEGAPAPDRRFAAVVGGLTESVTEVGTVRYRMVVTLDEHDGFAAFVTVGAYDLAARRATSTATIEGDLWAQLAAEGEPVPPGLDQPVEEILDGDVLYIRAPIADPMVGAGWIARSVEEVPVGALGLPVPWSGPLSLLEPLRDSRDLVHTGGEEVRGVATERYETTLDLWSEALEGMPGLRSAVDPALGAELSGVPATVWIDGDGRLRRLVLDLDGATLALELYDYGEPVEITVPPPSEVRPVEDVLGAAPP